MIGGVILAIAFYISFFIKMIIEEPLFQYLTFFNVLKGIFLVPFGSFLAGLYGELIFIIPVFVFSLIYAGLKLTRKLKSFFIIALTVMIGIIPFILFSMDTDYRYSSRQELFPKNLFLTPQLFTLTDLQNMHAGHFIMIALAVVSSLIMAWFALPKPEDLEDE